MLVTRLWDPPVGKALVVSDRCLREVVTEFEMSFSGSPRSLRKVILSQYPRWKTTFSSTIPEPTAYAIS